MADFKFTQLTQITGNKDHDRIDNNGQQYDAKFYKGGLHFKPSNQIGANRIQQRKYHEKAKNLYTFVAILPFTNYKSKICK